MNQRNCNRDSVLIQLVRKDVITEELFRMLLLAGVNVWARDAVGNIILRLLFGEQNRGWDYSRNLIVLLPWQEMVLFGGGVGENKRSS